MSEIQKRRVLMKTVRQKKVKYFQLLLLFFIFLGPVALADPNPPTSSAAKMPLSPGRNNDNNMLEEIQRLKALKATILSEKQIAAQRFIRRVVRIFSSMQDDRISSMSSRHGTGILRKDIDRYDDAVVEATGEVPEELIAYVEETYRELRIAGTSIAFLSKHMALRLWDIVESFP